MEMSQPSVRITKPEDEELRRKKAELSLLESQLVDRELYLTSVRSDLAVFERKYVRAVGQLYAELDEIEAKTAEEFARNLPQNVQAQSAAGRARDRAAASRSAVDLSLAAGAAANANSQSQSLRSLYREVAKRIHPDLAIDSADRARRQRLMADANRAYEEGDEDRLRAILEEYEISPETVSGEGTAAELVRVIRKIAQIQRRLEQIKWEVQELRESELWELKTRVEQAAEAGRDLLAEIAEDLTAQIAISRERLESLSPKRSRV
jgi:hypothetical protein